MKRDILCSKCGGLHVSERQFSFRTAGNKFYGIDRRDNPPSNILIVTGYAVSDFLCDLCGAMIPTDDYCFARSIYNKHFSSEDVEIKYGNQFGADPPTLEWHHDYITQKKPDSFEDKLRKL